MVVVPEFVVAAFSTRVSSRAVIDQVEADELGASPSRDCRKEWQPSQEVLAMRAAADTAERKRRIPAHAARVRAWLEAHPEEWEIGP